MKTKLKAINLKASKEGQIRKLRERKERENYVNILKF